MVLLEHIEDVALVTRRVHAPEEAVDAVAAMLHAGVVAGRHELGIERGQAVHEGAVLNVLVAAHAWVWCTAGGVFGHETVDHVLFELLFEVHDVVTNAELAGHAARVIDIFDATALLVAGEFFGAGFGPETHGHSHHVVPLFDEQGRSDGAIHSAGHADNNAGQTHGVLRFLCTRTRVDVLRGAVPWILRPLPIRQLIFFRTGSRSISR